jgi:hypothetical protein
MRTAKYLVAVVFMAGSFALLHAAQIQNPIQAAKDAYNKAKQQQQQQNKPPQQSAPQGQATQPVQSSAAAPGSPAANGDCCTPEAMKKIAALIGFVDIVGIKLGMTPEQAVAAVKGYNPNLKIVTLTARLEHPSGPPGNFVRVPYTIDAYTTNNRQDLGPVEWIAMQFTMPPGPPLLAKVQRFTGFPINQPVMASNLVESLRKKYGQDNYASTGRGWVYDSNGKLLTRVSNAQGVCPGDSLAKAVPGGGATHEGSETGAQVSLSNTTDPSNPALSNLPEAGPDCAPIVWVVASSNVGEDAAPNSQQTSMTVTMESGALMYMSRRATHAWLQAELDAKIKQDNDAAAGRSAPKL